MKTIYNLRQVDNRTVGLFQCDDGTFQALTLAKSSPYYKTQRGAENWLNCMGYGAELAAAKRANGDVVKLIEATRDGYKNKYKKGDALRVCLVPSALNRERFLVRVYDENNIRVNGLIHGPWARPTAVKNAEDLASTL